MKVILLEDVKKKGKKGEVVEVSDGYAYNFLIPNKKAVKLTQTSLDIKKEEDSEKEKEKQKQKQEAKELKEKLEKSKIIIKVKTGENDKMFGSVSSKNIVDEYKKQLNIELDKRKFLKTHNVGELGFTRIDIELYKNVIAPLNIHVEKED